MKRFGGGMIQQMQAVCPDCNGEGESIENKDKCKQCLGKKVTKQKKSFEEVQNYWIPEIQYQCHGNTSGLQVCIAGNKSDLVEQRVIYNSNNNNINSYNCCYITVGSIFTRR